MDERINFEAIVRNSSFVRHLKSDAKEDIIRELIDALDRDGHLPDRDEAYQVVMNREATMSTGLAHGVAMPHGKSTTVQNLVAAFGLKPEGTDFKALDDQPSTLFVMVLSDIKQPTPHMQFLGELGRCLSCPAVREKLMQAETIDCVADVLMER